MLHHDVKYIFSSFSVKKIERHHHSKEKWRIFTQKQESTKINIQVLYVTLWNILKISTLESNQ